MSILIKGMEMPRKCLDCPMCDNNDDCVMQEDKHFQTWEEQKDGCPLTEVPVPHGRLIDADALDKRVRQAGGTADAEVNCTEDFNDGILFVLDYFVKSMQTVIEAEGTE